VAGEISESATRFDLHLDDQTLATMKWSQYHPAGRGGFRPHSRP